MKIKNTPMRIYLQVESWEGCLCEDGEIDFKDLDLEAVTWSTERQSSSDIEYIINKFFIVEEND